MIVYFCSSGKKIFWPHYEAAAPGGIPVLKAVLPPQYSSRRLERLGGRLYRKGIRRFLAADPALPVGPLDPVSPLPLYRAKGGELALELVSFLPVRERRVALRGETAGPEAWRIAEELCPRVGELLLDFDRGEESLGRRLREKFGAVTVPLGRGHEPQAAVELSPRPDPLPRTLRLWGESDLLGLTLLPEEPLPSGFPQLPLLELLWETGRVELDRIRVVRRRIGLDRREENTYNNRTVL